MRVIDLIRKLQTLPSYAEIDIVSPRVMGVLSIQSVHEVKGEPFTPNNRVTIIANGREPKA